MTGVSTSFNTLNTNSGSRGIRRGNCYFRVVDRTKDMILVSRFKACPNEVEDVLVRHPGVLKCTVIKMPDGASGAALTLWFRRANASEEQKIPDALQQGRKQKNGGLASRRCMPA